MLRPYKVGLKGAKEFEKGFLIAGFELLEFFGDVFGFAMMTEDGVKQRDGSAVVHQTRVQADTPERSSADFIGGTVESGNGEIFPGDPVHVLAVMLGHRLDDAVASADVVEQEVAVRMKLLFTECGGDGRRAAVDAGACGSSGQGLNVAGNTANGVE